MSDDTGKPDPVDDLRKGLGLLFRAAKTAVKKLPTDDLEQVVSQGAREVGRALENVATTIERELFGKHSPENQAENSAASTAEQAAASDTDATERATHPDSPAEEAKPDENAPKGPRVDPNP